MPNDPEHSQSQSDPPREIRSIRPAATELVDPQREAQRQPLHARTAHFPTRTRLALGLFAATCASTFLVAGLSYTLSLMMILLFHEMGHYLQSRRYTVPASLPYFIPFPLSPIGTMGAVIVQGAGVADRKALFDIAITGPLAGLVLALPITYIGFQNAEIVPIDGMQPTLAFGEPLLIQWMISHAHGTIPDGHTVLMGPVAFAGWVGIFITALNLIPIGQLDGGHILYTLIGRRAHTVAVLLLGGAVAYMIYSQYYAYGLMILLLMLMGPKHPPTADDNVPLGTVRVLLGWLTLAFIVIGFTPQPIMLTGTP